MITTLTKTSSEDNDGSAQYKKVLDLAQLGLKAVILINGVAAISLLTFVGGIMSASIIGLSVISPHFIYAMGSFGFGVLFGAVAILPAYLSENYYMHSRIEEDQSKDMGISDELRLGHQLQSQRLSGSSGICQIVGFCLVVISLVSFCCGVVLFMMFLCNIT